MLFKNMFDFNNGSFMMSSRPYGGGGQVICYDSATALILKKVTMRGGVSKIVQNCLTSFMDDPSQVLN